MIRALITAALLAGAAMHFFGAQPDVAIGYSLVVSLTLWFFWPLLRRIPRLGRRGRRRATSRTPAPAPHLTQINHHHYYGRVPLPRRRCRGPTTAVRRCLCAPRARRRTTRSTTSSTRRAVHKMGSVECTAPTSRSRGMTGLESPGLSDRGEDVRSMDTDPDDDQPTDRGWDNRRLILASLAPRTATRPARRGAAPDADADPLDDPAAAKKPGLLSRGLRASGRAAAAGGRAFDNRVPRENRARVAIMTVAAVVILLVALAGVNFLTTDVNPPATPRRRQRHHPRRPASLR